MAISADTISQGIVNQLKLLDPTVSAEVGTPERKIVDATAEMIASQQVDFTVLNQQTDIATLSGGRLDAYLSIFNFGRQQAAPSYGTVTFSRNTNATNQIVIPRGTQVQANLDDSLFPSLIFVTTDTVAMGVGTSSISVTAQCTVSGSIGNIDAGKIIGFAGLQSVAGISSITNTQAFTGGTDAETDDGYKVRFQNSFMRNISGTTDMFLALAVSMSGVTKANVVGAISRYQEYVQVPAADDAAQRTDAITNNNYDPGASLGTVTVTIASPAVFTLTAHGLKVNDVVYLTTSGALPTGLTASTLYYVIAAGLTANSFEVSATEGGAAVNTSGTQSGTHTVFHMFWPHKRTSAVSTIPYSQFTYPVNYYLTNGTLDPATAMFFRPGADYVFNSPPINAAVAPHQSTTTPTTSPNVTFLNPFDATFNATGNSAVASGGVLLLEHAYISTHSRNNYAFGVLNCVDVFINGANEQQVSSSETIPLVAAHKLQSSLATSWTYQLVGTTNNFTRKLDSVASAVGSIIEPLYWQPVTQLPDSITIGTDTYLEAQYWNPGDSTYYWDAAHTLKAHYIFVEETNANYGTVRARNGIEWFQAGNNYLNGQLSTDTTVYNGTKIETHTGTTYQLSYFFDQNVADGQAIMEKNKQTTQDVLVHRSRVRYFQPIVTIMYSFGVTQAVVNASIYATLASFFENQYYGTAIQLSDILQTIHNVPGVDNVRFTNTVGNAVNEVSSDGSTVLSTHTADFYIQDSELADSPSGNQAIITVRAQNTWGT